MTEEAKSTWRFPKEFWTANVTELFERMAYYACLIYLVVYLTREVGFDDSQAGTIAALFAFFTWFIPSFMGALADKWGFRLALTMAYAFLTIGYLLLGAFPIKSVTFIAMIFIMLGLATVKPVITGTSTRCSDEHNRARAFSLYYLIVNFGAFIGKLLADPVRSMFRDDLAGISGLREVNYYAALAAFVGLIITLVAYRAKHEPGKGKSFGEILNGLGKVVTNARFMCLIFITAGFWFIQGQLYATMPKYLLRIVSDFAKPGWLANVNPLSVAIFVVPVTYLVRKIRPVSSIGIALLIIPFSALSVALTPTLIKAGILGDSVNLIFFSLHPVIITLVIGIAIQGVAECFLSPRYYEFASKQAPKGEEGLYMGYQFLNVAIAWLAAFFVSGHLLELWCPAREVVAAMPPEQAAHAYDHAHYIWYVYAMIGVAAFVALLIFRYVTDRSDRKADQQN
jgi:dipeptide/tripeptide permease